jgi:hypothetical protein
MLWLVDLQRIMWTPAYNFHVPMELSRPPLAGTFPTPLPTLLRAGTAPVKLVTRTKMTLQDASVSHSSIDSSFHYVCDSQIEACSVLIYCMHFSWINMKATSLCRQIWFVNQHTLYQHEHLNLGATLGLLLWLSLLDSSAGACLDCSSAATPALEQLLTCLLPLSATKCVMFTVID